MEALLSSQKQSLQGQAWPSLSGHSRRIRRGRRAESIRVHGPAFEFDGLLGNTRMQLLLRVQIPAVRIPAPRLPLSKLEELKVHRFTLAGREERIARSLATLQDPGAIQLSQDDWRWLDENSDIEDEFE